MSKSYVMNLLDGMMELLSIQFIMFEDKSTSMEFIIISNKKHKSVIN